MFNLTILNVTVFYDTVFYVTVFYVTVFYVLMLSATRIIHQNVPAFASFAKVLIAFCLAALCVSCSTTQLAQRDWPEQLPEREYYVALYEEDKGNQGVQTQDEYLKWVIRFYRGWALSPYSWDWLVSNALEQAAPGDREQLGELLASIGWRVSGEWAKDSKYRNINSSNLMTWGDALKLALRRGEYMDLVQRISVDVDSMLAYELHADAISFDRYFPPNNNVVAADERDYDSFDSF